MLKFGRCQDCGGPSPTTDAHSRQRVQVAYECQRPIRVLERWGETEGDIYLLMRKQERSNLTLVESSSTTEFKTLSLGLWVR